MIAIVSNAWLAGDDIEQSLSRYVSIVELFESVHRRVPGYRGRRLLRDPADPRHLVNVRFFEQASDYDDLVAEADYGEWIGRLSELVEPRDPQKVTFEVVHSLDIAP